MEQELLHSNSLQTEPAFGFYDARRAAIRVCIAALTAVLIGQSLGGIAVGLLRVFSTDPSVLSNWTMVLNAIVIDGIALPIGYLMIRRLPKRSPAEHAPVRLGFVALALPCCFALMYIGNLVGMLIGLLTGGLNDIISTFLDGASLWITLPAVVIIAPIMEELFFRKWILDRLEIYSPWKSILMSGLLFGFFHGNVTQFIYTFLLGAFLAAIYIKTHRVWIPILLHVLVNLFGGILNPQIISYVNPEELSAASVFASMYAMAFVAVVAAGVVFLICFRKRFFPAKEAKNRIGKAFFVNVGFILFAIISVLLMLFVELMPYIQTLIPANL